MKMILKQSPCRVTWQGFVNGQQVLCHEKFYDARKEAEYLCSRFDMDLEIQRAPRRKAA